MGKELGFLGAEKQVDCTLVRPDERIMPVIEMNNNEEQMESNSDKEEIEEIDLYRKMVEQRNLTSLSS